MNPRLYDLTQAVLGARRSNRRLQAVLSGLPKARIVIDVGGGTGVSAPLFPGALYVCLDVDRHRLVTFRRLYPNQVAIAADAARLPFASASVGLVLCRGVLHHLDDRRLAAFLDEAERVLEPHGSLIVLEPVFSARWWPGRILWRLDAGAHPRDAGSLRRLLEERFRSDSWQRYAIYHRYALATFSRAGDRTTSRPR